MTYLAVIVSLFNVNPLQCSKIFILQASGIFSETGSIHSQDDHVFSRIIIASSIISILISCFGIFALSGGTSLDRSREIGIRKVMGASSGGILLLLSGFYFKRILAAFVIAIPLANYLVGWWLRKFVYRIEIFITLFLVAAFFIVIITAFIISYPTIRSSLINPVKVLKHE